MRRAIYLAAVAALLLTALWLFCRNGGSYKNNTFPRGQSEALRM